MHLLSFPSVVFAIARVPIPSRTSSHGYDIAALALPVHTSGQDLWGDAHGHLHELDVGFHISGGPEEHQMTTHMRSLYGMSMHRSFQYFRKYRTDPYAFRLVVRHTNPLV